MTSFGNLPPPKMWACILSFFSLLWKRLTVRSKTLPPPKMWACILSFFYFCEKGSWYHLEPYPTKSVNMYFVVFFNTLKKAHGTSWNPIPTKSVNMYCFVFFYYCEKGSWYHLEPYSHQKCEHVFCRFFLLLWERLTVPSGTLPPPKMWACIFVVFFSTVKKVHGTIWNPTPTKSVSMYFVVFLVR